MHMETRGARVPLLIQCPHFTAYSIRSYKRDNIGRQAAARIKRLEWSLYSYIYDVTTTTLAIRVYS